MKIFYFDLETTGLDEKLHAIHQLSGAIEINGTVIEKFNYNIRPHEGALYDPEAMKLSMKTKELMQLGLPINHVYQIVVSMLSKHVNRYDKTDKFYLAGFNNAAFDNRHLRMFFIRNNDLFFGSWFWSNCMDAMLLATRKLAPIRHTMPNFKLATVAQFLGVQVDESKLHDAEYDIYLTMEILKRV